MAEHPPGDIVPRPAVQADHCQVVPGLAETGAGQLHAGHRRVDTHPLRAEAIDEAATDAEKERIAAGEYGHVTLLQGRSQLGEQGAQWRDRDRPGRAAGDQGGVTAAHSHGHAALYQLALRRAQHRPAHTDQFNP